MPYVTPGLQEMLNPSHPSNGLPIFSRWHLRLNPYKPAVSQLLKGKQDAGLLSSGKTNLFAKVLTARGNVSTHAHSTASGRARLRRRAQWKEN